jgi:hypothetical protein
MAEALRVTVTHFDTLENRIERALSTEVLGTFVGDEAGTPHEKVAELLKGLAAPRYLGWDGNVYPKVRVEKIQLQ